MLSYKFDDDSVVTIDYSERPGDHGRQRFDWTITCQETTFEGNDLQSGVLGGTLLDGMLSLLSFLGAAAESGPDGEHGDLFPGPVVEWAAEMGSDEFAMAAEDLGGDR